MQKEQVHVQTHEHQVENTVTDQNKQDQALVGEQKTQSDGLASNSGTTEETHVEKIQVETSNTEQNSEEMEDEDEEDEEDEDEDEETNDAQEN